MTSGGSDKSSIPGLGLSTEAPRISKSADFGAVSLSPQEGFVLSRIDGHTTIGEICLISGLGEEATLDILRRLKAARLVVTSAPLPEPAAATAAAAGHGSALRPGQAAVPSGSPRGAAPAAPAGPEVRLPAIDEIDPELLADGKDLPIETKRRILGFQARMRGVDHFELLGVARDAERQEIKRAYFRLSKEFHPDRYYGMDLGGYRERMAQIFRALSAAFDILSRDDERAAYLARLPRRGG